MAIISSYKTDINIQPGDTWASSDVGTRRTRKISVSGLADYLNASGSIVVAGQMAFKYVSFPEALPGTFRKASADSTVDIAWDSFPSLEVSKFDAAHTDISPILNYLVNEQIMISSTTHKNYFGHYRVTSYSEASTQDFYILELEYLGGYGTLTLDNSYNITKFSLDREADVSDKHYIHDQGVPSISWTINHNLNKFPSVSAVDTASNLVMGQVEYIDRNNLIVTFNASFSGEAYLN
jgi:hypothetical protein